MELRNRFQTVLDLSNHLGLQAIYFRIKQASESNYRVVLAGTWVANCGYRTYPVSETDFDKTGPINKREQYAHV